AKVKDVRQEELAQYDLIGFGSGIYLANFHNKIYKFIKKMPSGNRKVFIFSTAGSGEFKKKPLLLSKLSEKGCEVVGEFICPGEFSPLGINVEKKGRPDEQDLESARKFAKGLLS
ncbi:flavodoxin, partial [Trinickia caryophylli]|uniref:flavodoxin n=1 Tax=Trinickia caryophylli TaxID=28094 RepID=UPI000C88DA84